MDEIATATGQAAHRKAHPCVDAAGGPVVAYMILCPACGHGHRFDVGRWSFNGNLDEPTFAPSLLVRSVAPPPFAPGTDDYARGPDGKYLLGADGRLAGATDTVCHSFVRGGRIEFLSDCTHALAGTTVDLERW